MSTSLLYHGFGVRGYRYQRTDYGRGEVVFTITQPRQSYRCAVPRVECAACGAIRRVKIGFADSRVTYTRSFERYALELSGCMTIKDVADHLGITWDVIKGIQERNLRRRFAKPKLKHLKQIAIDEISVGKGHRYITIVMDLQSGAVVHVGQGKGGDALEAFWKRLRSSGAKIEAVATDMSPAYIDAVTTYLPGATLVFDRFHVIKLYNDKLSDLRRDLYRQLQDTMQKNVLKGVRWLLLKRPENLDPSRKEPERLREALRLNEPLAIAHYLLLSAHLRLIFVEFPGWVKLAAVVVWWQAEQGEETALEAG